MENIRKFVLVPPELYSKLKKDNLSAIDKHMHEILFDTELSDSEKWKLYSQCLQRYLHFFNEENKEVPLEIIEKGVKSDESPKISIDNQRLEINSFPEHCKVKGVILYNFIKSYKLMHWSKDGEVTIDGTKIVGSNIVDLIASSVGAGPVGPTGKIQFLAALQKSNIPKRYYVLESNVSQPNAAVPSTSGAQTEESEAYSNAPSPQHRAMTRVRRKYVPYQHTWEHYRF